MKDSKYINYLKEKDKTAKLSTVIFYKNRAIVTYPGGDNTCLWSNIYLLLLKDKKLKIIYIGGFSAMYGGAVIPFTQE